MILISKKLLEGPWYVKDSLDMRLALCHNRAVSMSAPVRKLVLLLLRA